MLPVRAYVICQAIKDASQTKDDLYYSIDAGKYILERNDKVKVEEKKNCGNQERPSEVQNYEA